MTDIEVFNLVGGVVDGGPFLSFTATALLMDLMLVGKAVWWNPDKNQIYGDWGEFLTATGNDGNVREGDY